MEVNTAKNFMGSRVEFSFNLTTHALNLVSTSSNIFENGDDDDDDDDDEDDDEDDEDDEEDCAVDALDSLLTTCKDSAFDDTIPPDG
jgi:hypothetical protein